MSLSLPRRLFRLFLPRMATFRQKATTRPVTLGCGRIAVPHERNSTPERFESPFHRRRSRGCAAGRLIAEISRRARADIYPNWRVSTCSGTRCPQLCRGLWTSRGCGRPRRPSRRVSWTMHRVRSLGKERALELIGVHKDRLCEYACVQQELRVRKWARDDLGLPAGRRYPPGHVSDDVLVLRVLRDTWPHSGRYGRVAARAGGVARGDDGRRPGGEARVG